MNQLIVFLYVLLASSSIYVRFSHEELIYKQNLVNIEMQKTSLALFSDIYTLSQYIEDKSKRASRLEKYAKQAKVIAKLVSDLESSNYLKTEASFTILSETGYTNGISAQKKQITWLELNTILSRVHRHMTDISVELEKNASEHRNVVLPVLSARRFYNDENIFKHIRIANGSRDAREIKVKVNGGPTDMMSGFPFEIKGLPKSISVKNYWQGSYSTQRFEN